MGDGFGGELESKWVVRRVAADEDGSHRRGQRRKERIAYERVDDGKSLVLVDHDDIDRPGGHRRADRRRSHVAIDAEDSGEVVQQTDRRRLDFASADRYQPRGVEGARRQCRLPIPPGPCTKTTVGPAGSFTHASSRSRSSSRPTSSALVAGPQSIAPAVHPTIVEADHGTSTVFHRRVAGEVDVATRAGTFAACLLSRRPQPKKLRRIRSSKGCGRDSASSSVIRVARRASRSSITAASSSSHSGWASSRGPYCWRPIS